ncbi:MAG TPA: substrate-binding domain-containing protein, partial [Rectinemataceae bacterium]|nr:substrate-binding domain-containing protein [Rectinemataceae bacterium]
MLASLHTGASLGVWPSVADEAERLGADLFCFPGGRIGLREGHEASRNAIYDLAARVPLDGLLVWTSSLSGVEQGGAVGAFLDRFRGRPLVSLSSGAPGVPVVTIDYYGGMREAMRHAIKGHGFRRVAFIRGPALHPGAEERYQAYLDSLEAAGIGLDPRLVSPPCPWDSGREALLELIDGRGLVPGRDFLALVASSDLMALWAARTLLARGYRIPEDIAVIGMNNSLESRLSTPPLTTVEGPFAELGAKGFRTLMALVSGEQVEERSTLPATLVVRQSCGCPSSSFVLAATSGGPPPEAS